MAHSIDIPDEVEQVLQEGRLVFFCGAGISRYTGLPDFKNLTKDAFRKCATPLEERRKYAAKPWDHAFRAGQYDKALQLLPV